MSDSYREENGVEVGWKDEKIGVDSYDHRVWSSVEVRSVVCSSDLMTHALSGVR